MHRNVVKDAVRERKLERQIRVRGNWKSGWWVLACIMLVFVPLVFFFGWYTFLNPDGKHCYYDAETEVASIIDDGKDNVTDAMRLWFGFNFFSLAVITVFICIAVVLIISDRDGGETLLSISILLFAC